MFTGIVEELGYVRAITPNATGATLEIEAHTAVEDAVVGASIAVNGTCLTVTAYGRDWWRADVVEETMRRTSLGALRPGDRVNLERPVRLGDRLGGYVVQGHVDGVATIARRQALADGSLMVHFGLDARLARYIVEKGFITVDGISLTVVEAGDAAFSVTVIPQTQALTTLGFKHVGDPVNIEVDYIAKYVERLLPALLRPHQPQTPPS